MTTPMSESTKAIISQFLPSHAGAATSPTKSGNSSTNGSGGAATTKSKASADNTRIYRELNQYGINLIAIVHKDYSTQISLWKTAFSEVLAAYATAIDNRNNTLEAAKEERAHDAAVDALIFSLVTAGAMRFVGAWVQYSLVPSVKDLSKIKLPTPYMSGMTPVIPRNVTPPEFFSKLQSSAFGGIAQDLGNAAVRLSFPRPGTPSYSIDSWSGVENLRTDLSKNMDESSRLVLEQFGTVQSWMNEVTDFGEAWLTAANGEVEKAREKIRLQFDNLRRSWAHSWEFFGKTPNSISRPALARHYERCLWASHVNIVLNQALEDKKWVTLYDYEDPLVEGYVMGLRKLIEVAVVERLMELDVVYELRSQKQQWEQLARISSPGGTTSPTVLVQGAVNTHEEAKPMLDWTEKCLSEAPLKSVQSFLPAAKTRTIAPLPSWK
jgi:hypothetical protein